MLRTRYPLLLVFLFLVEGCGFRLRGSGQIAERYQPLYLDVLAASESQTRDLRQVLGKAGVLISDVDENVNRLRVAFIRKRDARISGSTNTSVTLVEIEQQLRFSVVDAQGRAIVSEDTIGNSQTVELDSNNVLSHESELDDARAAQGKAMIRSLLFRLRK